MSNVYSYINDAKCVILNMFDSTSSVPIELNDYSIIDNTQTHVYPMTVYNIIN